MGEALPISPSSQSPMIGRAIAISMGAEVLGEIRTDQTANSYERNASTNGLDALNELSDWLPTIALIVAAAVIIGIIVVYLARRFG